MKKITMIAISGALFYTASVMAAGVLVEGEAHSAGGGGSVNNVTDRPGTSGGTAIAGWNNNGHWLEWKVEVPEAGDYQVVLRYAGGRGWPVYREVQINGKVPSEAFAKVELPPTGGFGRAATEWKNLAVAGADGKPATVKLEKGPTTVRMLNLGGSGSDGAANLDAIVLISGSTTVESLIK